MNFNCLFYFCFCPGLAVSGRKHGVEYPSKNIHATHDVKHQFPFFRTLDNELGFFRCYVYNKIIGQYKKYRRHYVISMATYFILDDITGQYGSDEARYGAKRTGYSQQQAAILRR